MAIESNGAGRDGYTAIIGSFSGIAAACVIRDARKKQDLAYTLISGKNCIHRWDPGAVKRGWAVKPTPGGFMKLLTN